MTGKLAVRLSMKGTYNEGKNYLFTMKGTVIPGFYGAGEDGKVKLSPEAALM